jgi:hypothetical protein
MCAWFVFISMTKIILGNNEIRTNKQINKQTHSCTELKLILENERLMKSICYSDYFPYGPMRINFNKIKCFDENNLNAKISLIKKIQFM